MTEKPNSNISRKKFSWSSFLFYSFIGLLFALLCTFILKYYYTFYKVDENIYARLFYTWMSKHAYKSFMKTWEFIPKNDWDDKNEELNNFVIKAQGDGDKMKEDIAGPLLCDFYPEHFSRYPQNQYYTVSYDWNERVFLPFRKYFVVKDQQENKENKKKVLDYFKEKKKDSLSLFWGVSKEKFKDVRINNQLQIDAVNEMAKICASLKELLHHIVNSKDDEKILNKTDPEKNEIVRLTYNLFNKMEYEHSVLKRGKKATSKLTRQNCLDFWKNLGSATSSPYETLVYSRLFYTFYFYNLHLQPENVTEKVKGKEVTKKQNPKQILEARQRDFARIMAQAFKKPEEVTGFAAFFSPKYEPLKKMEIDHNTLDMINDLEDSQDGGKN